MSKTKTRSSRTPNTKPELVLTPREVAVVKRSLASPPPRSATVRTLAPRHFKYVCISDTHVGEKQFDEALWEKLVAYLKQEKPDFIVHPGDHLEGMSGRPGHVYGLNQVGFDSQFERYRALLSTLPSNIPIFGIDGNHDGWYHTKGDMGIVVGAMLQKTVKQYKHLGQWEGTVQWDGIRIMLVHANDGTAHASSWKLEKRIDSLDGGHKPHILHSGHYHKAVYVFRRNVHGFESGTFCRQTTFMRGKNLPAHVGFWGVEVFHDSKGIDRLKQEFVPGY